MDPETVEQENVEILKDLQESGEVLIEVNTDDGVYQPQYLKEKELLDVAVMTPMGVRFVINMYAQEFQVYEIDDETGEETLRDSYKMFPE